MVKGEYRILVVDDEARYLWAIRINLEARGYEVITAEDGRSAIKQVAAREPDLVLLDIRMPGMDGLEACRRIREFSTVPIIVLTALAEEADIVTGLGAGADDYVTKPFGAEELLARVQAALRRADLGAGLESQPKYQAGDLLLDFAARRVFMGGEEVGLTPTEYRLLAELAKQVGRVLVPELLLERVWGPGYETEHGLLRQAVHRLRRKIEPDPSNPQYIQTRTGIGYILERPE
jgi:DNA-binding response OmpR family regulator